MPIPSPFHERTAPLCTSNLWMDWSGRLAARQYDASRNGEYYALRYAAGLIDVSPLWKYDVKGPDAARYISRLMTRDLTRLPVGRAAYACWCDQEGKVLDDGAVFRLEEDLFRISAGESMFHWFSLHSRGFRVAVEDVTGQVAALAVQGPTSRDLLQTITDVDLTGLKFYSLSSGRIGDVPVVISRTGYTGDLGFEVWMQKETALTVWDSIWHAGRSYGLEPVGQDALEVARIEAGLLLNGVDFHVAAHCLTENEKSTPYELGLDPIVNLDRDFFIGQPALKKEKETGPHRKIVGLDLDWDRQETLYQKRGLPPMIDPSAWQGAPVYNAFRRQIGKITSAAWSPVLKKSLALAELKSSHTRIGNRVRVEYTIDSRRSRVPATVVHRTFFNPKRKTA